MSPQSNHRRFWLAVSLSGLLSVLFFTWLIVRLGGPRVTNVMDNLVQWFAGFVAMIMCAASARRHHQRTTGWALLAASLCATECGNAIWCYYDIIRGQLAARRWWPTPLQVSRRCSPSPPC